MSQCGSDSGVLAVGREEFLALRHDGRLGDDAECVQKIKDTMMKVSRRRPAADRGRGRGRGRGFTRAEAQWARHASPGKRPLRAASHDPARDLAAACNKLSASNFDKICSVVTALVGDDEATSERLLDSLFDNAVISGSFSDLYVRMFNKLRIKLPDRVRDAIARAADRFSAAGGTVMPLFDARPEQYDEFCQHAKNRRVRLSTLGVLVRLGVDQAAGQALDAFEQHVAADKGDVQLDLVVDGLAQVNAMCPALRGRVDSLTKDAIARSLGAMDARTRFKLLDVAESCRKMHRQSASRRAS